MAPSSRPAAVPTQPVDDLTQRLKRTEVQRQPLSIPGREMVQVLTEIPPGVESGWHIHPGEEVGYILAGTVEMMIRNQATLVLNAGDPFLIPPRSIAARTRVACSRPTSSRWASRWRLSRSDGSPVSGRRAGQPLEEPGHL